MNSFKRLGVRLDLRKYRQFSFRKQVAGGALHVEQYNPAMKLYRRLGFEMVEEQGVYHLMRFLPQTDL